MNKVDLSDDDPDPDHRPQVGPPAEKCGFNTEDPEIPGLEEASRSLFDEVAVLVPFDSPLVLHCSGVKLPIRRPYAVPMAVPDEVLEAEAVHEEGEVDVAVAVEGNVAVAVEGDVAVAVEGDVAVAVEGDVAVAVEGDVAVAVEDDVAVVTPLPNAAPVPRFIRLRYQVLMDSLGDRSVSNLINWVDEYHFEVKNGVQLAQAYFGSKRTMSFGDMCRTHHFVRAAQPNVWRHQTEFFRMGKPELLEQIGSGIAQILKDEGTSGQANIAQNLEGVQD